MYTAVFLDAAGKEVHKIDDDAFTTVPVDEYSAAESAVRRLRIDVENGKVPPQTETQWTHVDVSHGYGRDRLERRALGL